MKKSSFNAIVVLIHVIYWLPTIVQVFYVYSFPHPNNMNFLYKALVVGAVAAIFCFYISYLLLFPAFLYKKKIAPFVIYTIATVLYAIIFSFFVLFHRKLTHSDWTVFVTNVAIRSIYSCIAACFLKGFITWYTEIRYKEQLEKKNLETSFALLKAQTNPHFLFNTLNNIDVLIEKEPATASVYLKKLSDILRFTLYETPSEQIALSDELKYIEQYIDLQRIRTANPDFVKFEVQGDAAGISIAPMLFIPFIENSFKHCTNKKLNNAIQITIAVQRQSIIFSCSNVYAAQSIHPQQNSGLGLQLIQTRLDMLYPDAYQLDVDHTADRFNVNLSIHLNNDH